MKLFTTLKVYALLVALSLLVFVFLPNPGLMDLVKLFAAATAITILSTFLYPMIRGVNKGDTVVVVGESMPAILGRTGKALVDAKKGNEIRVRLRDGREVIGILEDYEGFFSPPKVRILFERGSKKGEYI